MTPWELNTDLSCPPIITRALALIEAGAPDGASVAGRLGVDEHSLQHLFTAQVGTPMEAVATMHRLSLARQLLDATSLSLVDLADVAGFSSLQHFNEAFQTIFKHPPGSRRSDRSGETGRLHEIRLLLPYQPPYDWPAMLTFLRARAISGIETVVNGVYQRSFDLQGVTGALSVEPGATDALQVTIRSAARPPLLQLLARVRAQFDLAADPQRIASQLGRHALLAPLIQARPGLRLPGSWDGFELAVRAVLNQQITTAGAIRIAGKLVQQFGTPVAEPLAPGLTHLFPTATRLAEAELSALGLPGARRAALKGVAGLLAAQPELLALHAERESALAALRAIPGIGDWTAQYIALRGLRDTDAFPAGDVVLRKALSRLTGIECDQRQAKAFAEAWRPSRGYAAQYLWGL
ncbi:AlkA N-terminal domain-containing protein [Chitinimonas lacunae]|uniref:DNA-3-methyladenine glycosylase II n=1 Tax=Chitinimonas lacunae TaxID=1963018 RepID=A0ABV8MQG4_9NEIS